MYSKNKYNLEKTIVGCVPYDWRTHQTETYSFRTVAISDIICYQVGCVEDKVYPMRN